MQHMRSGVVHHFDYCNVCSRDHCATTTNRYDKWTCVCAGVRANTVLQLINESETSHSSTYMHASAYMFVYILVYASHTHFRNAKIGFRTRKPMSGIIEFEHHQ